MKSLFFFCFASILCICGFASEPVNWKQKSENADFLHRSIKQVTDVIVHDIYSPPVASRIYAYITIAGYEAAIHNNQKYITLAGQLNNLTPVPNPDPKKEYCFSLASVQAILSVGKALVISEEKIEAFQSKMLEEFKKTGMPDEVFKNSILYGKAVADHILAWAAKDNYKQTRSFAKYDISDDVQTWKPTPPSYMKAVEPHWNKIRTFIIDSAQQFKPARPTPFSIEKNSQFYKEALAVHDIGIKLTPEQNAIANFWDCNPFKMNLKGHVMYATKKISPGGHWINITRLACKKANADFVQATEAYASVSIALADCFISCWMKSTEVMLFVRKLSLINILTKAGLPYFKHRLFRNIQVDTVLYRWLQLLCLLNYLVITFHMPILLNWNLDYHPVNLYHLRLQQKKQL